MPNASVAEPPISSRKLLAVEGKDEKQFFLALFKHMRMSPPDVRIVGGKDNFPKKLPGLTKIPEIDFFSHYNFTMIGLTGFSD